MLKNITLPCLFLLLSTPILAQEQKPYEKPIVNTSFENGDVKNDGELLGDYNAYLNNDALHAFSGKNSLLLGSHYENTYYLSEMMKIPDRTSSLNISIKAHYKKKQDH